MIRKVVGKNFNEIVLNSNKDVLVKWIFKKIIY